nr:hypothetical protein [Tanacetum cinerariifolium]
MLDLDFIPSDNFLPEYEIFYFDIEEKNSGSTNIHADISLPDLECFNFNDNPDLGELTSIVDFGIRKNVLSAINVNLPPDPELMPSFNSIVRAFASLGHDLECSSCGTLYTRDCGYLNGNVKDKILVPKPPKNCSRYTRCGYLVDGPNCQGCALLRQELEENLVTHSPGFQNTSEPSNASTNVANAPREPYVVKQDHGSFVDKIIFYLNRAPDSPNQFHCFHCKDVLRDGEACK